MLNKILTLVFVLGALMVFTSCDDCEDCTITTLLEDVEVSSVTQEACDDDIDTLEATENLITDPTTGTVSGIRVSCN